MRAWLDECRRVAVSVSSRLGNTEILLLMLLSLWAPTMQLKTEGLFFFLAVSLPILLFFSRIFVMYTVT
jgi:hypothetical protein